MKTAAIAFTASLALCACTIVAPGGQDGGLKPIIIHTRPDGLPPPKSLEASVLYVVNLERSSANLANQYAGLMIGLGAYLQSIGLQIDNFGLIATYGDTFGPRLLLGRTQPTSPETALLAALAAAGDAGVTDYAALLPLIAGSLGNISDTDLPVALKLLASSGRFDGDGETSEAKNVVRFGQAIGDTALPPELGGLDRSALFDRPRDLFIVVYLQPLGRRCAIGTGPCLVDGRSPTDIFTEVGGDGGLTWLKYPYGSLRPEQVVQVAIATSEGESLTDFRNRCGAVPGFPKNLFDVIAPSDNAYFGPLMTALKRAHPGTGATGDFCTLIGGKAADAIKMLGSSVAAVADSASAASSSIDTL